VYQDPQVVPEDLLACYAGDYNTHAGGGEWTPRPAAHDSLRDRLRRAIRAASGESSRQPGGAFPIRLAGAVLALHPDLRRRARLGLVDGLEPPVGRTGRCLEIGPGQGVDLFALRTLGWEACGLDLDPAAAAVASRVSGCEVRVGSLETTDYERGSFDLVYLCHVLEHLPDPLSALGRCGELLRPGGRLVVVLPNPDALSARWYGTLSLVWDPPRHLVLPPQAAAVGMLQRAGFVSVVARTSAWNAAGLAEAARRRKLGRAWRPTALPRPSPAARAFSLAESLLVAVGLLVGEEIQLQARSRQAAESAPASSS
jgi:SAM-dependent methyltransferase